MAKDSEVYFPTFKGKNCEIHTMDMRLIRKFTMKAEVVNAQISGAGKESKIAITCKDGKTYVYMSDGRLVRQM